jgi:hypothetical protein
VRRVRLTDWWTDADRAIEEPTTEGSQPDFAAGGKSPTVAQAPEEAVPDAAIDESQRRYAEIQPTPFIALNAEPAALHRISDLTTAGFIPNADRFYAISYRSSLSQMATGRGDRASR